MPAAYRHPSLSVGDHVDIVLEKGKSEEGFVTEIVARREKSGEFAGWAYKVARVANDTVTEHAEADLRPRLVVMRQFTRRM